MNPLEERSSYLHALEAAILIAHRSWPTHRGTIPVKVEPAENMAL